MHVRPLMLAALALLAGCDRYSIRPCDTAAFTVELPHPRDTLELQAYACIDGGDLPGVTVFVLDAKYESPAGLRWTVDGPGARRYEDSPEAGADYTPALCDRGITIKLEHVGTETPITASLEFSAEAGKSWTRCDVRLERR